MKFKTAVFWVLFVLLMTCSAFAASVSDVRLSTFSNGTGRIVIESDSKLDSKIFALENPSRLVIDMQKSQIKKTVQKKEFKTNKVVSKVRFGKPEKGVARIVFDLAGNVSESHFILPPEDRNSVWRLVVDLKPTGTSTAAVSKAGTLVSGTAISKQMVKKNPIKSGGLLPFSKRKKIVMLDAGHGGKDPGAISKSGHYEKDLTLKMAKETKKLLENAGYKVVLSRDRDIFITLRGRVKKAHDAKADLFISIHADSARNTSARGLSIYTISEKASDKEAAALAERENKTDILFGMDLDDYQQEVSSVLIDLAKQDTMKESRRYADLVVKEMQRAVQLLPNAHRFAGFAVLKSPNIPSVLLEMGYMSNKKEEREMQKASYRKKLGQALVKAVDAYFKEIEN